MSSFLGNNSQLITAIDSDSNLAHIQSFIDKYQIEEILNGPVMSLEDTHETLPLSSTPANKSKLSNVQFTPDLEKIMDKIDVILTVDENQQEDVTPKGSLPFVLRKVNKTNTRQWLNANSSRTLNFDTIQEIEEVDESDSELWTPEEEKFAKKSFGTYINQKMKRGIL